MSEAAAYLAHQREDKEALIAEYLPLVKKIALHLYARLPADIDLDDLLQVGLMGLMDAAAHYDPSEGASFATYSGIRVRGAILDELRRLNWAPRSLQQKIKRLAEATRSAENRLGRVPTEAEIAAEMGLSMADYHQLVQEAAQCRLLYLDADESVETLLETETGPDIQLEGQAFRKQLAAVIDQLPEKEKLVMSLYYEEELNLREIGGVLEVSESRVCQLHGQALARIRASMGEWVET